ncbi:hypothetical protein SAMN05661012_05216 [Chitinophaga sancti]|uniref:Uncharacterized protein n=1 Tax=Chitinophaga sancti TaxID=1004 RepID=A0A1K1SE28_9BACT|nr:hypothetical protein SAMN05661012_05216 [Chitinophaga sancti]
MEKLESSQTQRCNLLYYSIGSQQDLVEFMKLICILITAAPDCPALIIFKKKSVLNLKE